MKLHIPGWNSMPRSPKKSVQPRPAKKIVDTETPYHFGNYTRVDMAPPAGAPVMRRNHKSEASTLLFLFNKSGRKQRPHACKPATLKEDSNNCYLSSCRQLLAGWTICAQAPRCSC